MGLRRHPRHKLVNPSGPQVRLALTLAAVIIMAVALVTIAFIWVDPGTHCTFGGG